MAQITFTELVDSVNCSCGYNNITGVKKCDSCGKELPVVVKT
jgi:hypothetical protein